MQPIDARYTHYPVSTPDTPPPPLQPAASQMQGDSYSPYVAPQMNAMATQCAPQPAGTRVSADALRLLAVVSGVTGAISIILAPFGILAVASNNPRWHNNAVKYSVGTLSIVFGVVSIGLGALGCLLGGASGRRTPQV